MILQTENENPLLLLVKSRFASAQFIITYNLNSRHFIPMTVPGLRVTHKAQPVF